MTSEINSTGPTAPSAVPVNHSGIPGPAPRSWPKVRLSIPFWGEAYLSKMLNITLPAVLAPGNLPALAQDFSVEIALVTESRFFMSVRLSNAFRRLQQYATVKLVSLDDMLTGMRGDYGPILTFALIRGYEDLGESMLDYYLMFLNADFILADGSYRTAARLMKEGHRVIHCPSFRAILEEVMPELEKRVDKKHAELRIPPRELVALALRHKHMTVKARIVNQRLCHQRYMDQFYWYVDDDTLVGCQWPIALVALKPERVMTTPPLMFDYGFIPEICPTAEKYYLSDSDDFFMLEPEKRTSGEDGLRLGWTTPEQIAGYLADYSTREHRECGQQLHVFHSAALPANLATVIDSAQSYIRDITSRLGPPKPHKNHPMFSEWWEGALARMEESRTQYVEDQRRRAEQEALAAAHRGGMEAANSLSPAAAKQESFFPVRGRRLPVARRPSALRSAVRAGYRRLFGEPGRLKPTHPLWIETRMLTHAFFEELEKGSSLLWVSNTNTALAALADRTGLWLSPADFQRDISVADFIGEPAFDACLLDLSLSECLDFKNLYERLRPVVRNGGHVYLNVVNRNGSAVPEDMLSFCETVLPDQDVSEAVFTGDRGDRIIQAVFSRAARPRFPIRMLNHALYASTILALAPFTYAANRRISRKAPYLYTPEWLNMFARFTVVRREDPACEGKRPSGIEHDARAPTA